MKTAQKPRRAGLSAGAWILLILAMIVAFAIASTKRDEERTARAQASFLADLHAGKLATAEAFEARCGVPRWTNQTSAGPELHYYNGGDYYVTIAQGIPQLRVGRVSFASGKAREYRNLLGDDFYFSALSCK